MPTSELLEVFSVVYFLAILIDWVRTRQHKRLLLELLPLIGLIVFDALIANATLGYVAFGAGTSSIMVVFIMLGAILLGIAARYIFYLRGAFSWADFVKPLCLSPLLLIPLLGSVLQSNDLQPIQVLSFGLLGFQNGFFWQAVLQRSRPKK